MIVYADAQYFNLSIKKSQLVTSKLDRQGLNDGFFCVGGSAQV
jgi:hypothetical protein